MGKTAKKLTRRKAIQLRTRVKIKGTSEIEKYPAQIICLVQQIDFCRRCERAITKSGLDDLEKKTIEEIQDLTNRKGGSNNLGKLKLTSVILDAVHHKDILKQVSRPFWEL